MSRFWCTKNHRHDGVLDYPANKTRVVLEAKFVVIGYGQDCRLVDKRFHTRGYER